MQLTRWIEPGKTIVGSASYGPHEHSNSGFFNFSKSPKILDWRMFAIGYTFDENVNYIKFNAYEWCNPKSNWYRTVDPKNGLLRGSCADTYIGITLHAYNRIDGEYTPPRRILAPNKDIYLGTKLTSSETDILVNLVNQYNHTDDNYTSGQCIKEMDDLFEQATKRQYPQYPFKQKIKRFIDYYILNK